MLSQVNYSEIKDIKQLRTEIQPWLSSTEYNFNWLKSIVESSLDEYLITFLKQYAPKYDRFITLDIKEHFSEVSSLINKCTEMRKRIFEVESTALTTAISYAEAINNLGPNETMTSLSLKAAFRQSGEEEDTKVLYQTAQDQKNQTVKNMLYAKFNLHNQSGSSLNYGEIVDALRKLYADNIKTIYERLFIIKRTLKYSFNQDTAALPNFYEVRNSLDDFIWWIRQELDHYDYIAQYDFDQTIVLALRTPEQVAAFKQNGYCTFEVTDLLLNTPSVNISNYQPRVSQLSVTVSGYNSYINPGRYVDGDKATYIDRRTNTDHKREAAEIDWILMNLNENRAGDYALKANTEATANSSFFTIDIMPPVVEVPLETNGLYNPTQQEQADFQKKIDNLNSDIFLPKKKISDFKKGAFGELEPVYEVPQSTENFITVPGKISYGPISIGRRAGELSDTNKFRGDQVLNIRPYGTWRLAFRNVSSDPNSIQAGLLQISNVELTLKLIFRKTNNL